MYDAPVAPLGPLTDDRPTVTFWRLDDVRPTQPVPGPDIVEALRNTAPPTLDLLRRVADGLRRTD